LTVVGLFSLAAPSAKADNWNFSLTDPSNTNTISFSFPVGSSTTVNEGYWFEINNPVTWFLNGADQGTTDLSFWNIGSGGGLVLGHILNLWGPQLYTGTESNPTLLEGTFAFNNTYGPYYGPLSLSATDPPDEPVSTPEPSSVVLLAAGLLGMLGLAGYGSRRSSLPSADLA